MLDGRMIHVPDRTEKGGVRFHHATHESETTDKGVQLFCCLYFDMKVG